MDGEEGRRLVPEVIDVTTPTLSTPMSMEYLRWRYGAIPAIQYYAAWTESSNGRAVVFFRMSSRYGLRGLRVSEVLSSCHNGGGAIVRELIKDVVAAVRPDYLLSVTAARAQSPGAMRRLGFLPAPGTGRTLLARELGEGVPAGVDPFKIGSWTLPLGSLEFV